MSGTRGRLFFIAVLTFVGLYIVLPIPNKPALKDYQITLGIDLAGGYEAEYVVYDPKPGTHIPDADGMNQLVSTLGKRINLSGLKEPRLTMRGENHILVQIPGVNKEGWEQYKEIIQTLGHLQLREVADWPTEDAWIKAGKPPKWDVWEPITISIKERKGGDDVLLCRDTPVVEGDAVKSAHAAVNPRNPSTWKIDFEISGASATARLGEATKRMKTENDNLRKSFPGEGEEFMKRRRKIAIVLDNEVLSYPGVEGEITDRGEITGGFTADEGEKLALILTTGRLKYPIGRRHSGDVKITFPGRNLLEEKRFSKDDIYAAITALEARVAAMPEASRPKVSGYEVSDNNELQVSFPSGKDAERFVAIASVQGLVELRSLATPDDYNKWKETRKPVPESEFTNEGRVYFVRENSNKKGDYLLFSKDTTILSSGTFDFSEVSASGGIATLKVNPEKLATIPPAELKETFALITYVGKDVFVDEVKISEDGKISFKSGLQDDALATASLKNPTTATFSKGKVDEPQFEQGVPEREYLVGPSLGQDSTQRGIMSVVISFIVVALFMIAYYRGFGFISVVGVALNVLYLVAVLACFEATLTLPGIGGIALVIGMAVDANIIMAERVREEMAKGKTAAQAFDQGTERSMSAIIDSNLTTIIGGLILMIFGVGPVRGFATTLVIGTSINIFTAVYCVRSIARFMLEAGTLQDFKFMKLFDKPQIDWAKSMKIWGTATAIVSLFCGYLLVTKSKDLAGIDFKGGSVLVVQLKDKITITQVRDTVGKAKNSRGMEKYPDLEVQAIPEADQKTLESAFAVSLRESKRFELRTAFAGEEGSDVNTKEFKKDVLTAFGSQVLPDPFEELTPDQLNYDGKTDVGGKRFTHGMKVNVLKEKMSEETAIKEVEKIAKPLVPKDGTLELVGVGRADSGRDDVVSLKVLLTADDKYDKALKAIRRELAPADETKAPVPLTTSAVISEGGMSRVAGQELVNNAFWALIYTWIAIIVYIWLRFFFSFGFGIAAVAALIHDVLIGLGSVVMAKLVLPESVGLQFEFNISSVAAALTIAGYSVNDTIVVFDRIRENLKLMKGVTLSEVINRSINEVVTRTVWTSLTTLFSVAILYFMTMNSGTGVSMLAFPLILGFVAGVYSSIFIASALLIVFFKDKKPVTEKG